MAQVNPKKWVQENSDKFNILRGKEIKIKINDNQITSNAVFQYVAPTKVADLGSLAPEKVQSENGKWETPRCFDVVFDQGTLTFVINDTKIAADVNGIVLSIGENIVKLEMYS